MVFKHDNVEGFLTKYIDVFSSLYVPRENWLAPREKEYFIGLALLHSKGIDLLSKEGIEYLENDLGFKNRGVSIYRKKLKDKGWIIQTKTSIKLTGAFVFKKIPKELIFNFKILWKEQ